jgi:DnaJ-class molecular chaperone
MTTRKDFYSVLGLKNTATRSEVDAAYQSLASKYHPDRNPSDRIGAQQKFNEVTEAYINLSNPARRH